MLPGNTGKRFRCRRVFCVGKAIAICAGTNTSLMSVRLCAGPLVEAQRQVEQLCRVWGSRVWECGLRVWV